MQNALEASLARPRSSGHRGAAFARTVVGRAAVEPLAYLAGAIRMARRRRQAAKELDHLLDLPDRIFRDIGITRAEAARARNRLGFRNVRELARDDGMDAGAE